ncbi:GNAT family N-acetyltransferase [Achromobacter spanius]|uniref:GNAT family N-acetyltransferase n=1 Tax=Achromobacter spanius TaxID=217203 RepID=A0A2S0IC13_9BURK|nr:GNAT family N-acetyltransferase [Achromobacter spanius]AVJ29307.1 GNAT family N-acetyltransferase [Achromobacter spanius]
MPTLIRPARPEDAALLPAIERSAGTLFRDAPGLEWIADDAVMSETEHLRLIAQGTSWVAQESEQLCGFLCGERFHDALHVWELAVDAGHQRMGIGLRLVHAACGHARAAGLAAVTLTTFRDLAWNAPWYARLGFREDRPLAGSRLHAVLAAEARHGLPAERRVAMRLQMEADV